MDSDLEKELNDLTYLIGTLPGQVNRLTNDINTLKVAQTQSSTSNTNNTTAKNNNKTTTTRFQQIMDEEDKKSNKFKKTIETTFGHSVDMISSFTGALVSSQTGLQKYARTVESLGNGVGALGEHFGLLGAGLTVVTGIFGRLASSILGLNDNILGIRNSFVQVGGVMPATTIQLGNLAKEAGFALDNIKTLSDKMTELSSSMLALGDTAGEGAVRFMQIANVEDSIRRQFGRMGVSQDQLLNLQGMYLENQKLSGGHFRNEFRTTQEIQNDSLQYAKTLLSLSSLTGKSVDTLQKEINSARLEMREQARIYREEQEIASLESQGRTAEAAIKRRQSDNRKAMITVFASAYDRETAIQMATIMETGVITEETAGVAMLIPEVLRMASQLKNSNDIAADLSSAIVEIDNAYRTTSSSLAETLDFYPELADAYGLRMEAMLSVNNRTQGMTLARVREIIEGRGQEGQDQLEDNIEGVRSFERESKKLFQTLLDYIDPMKNFNMTLTVALGVAAAALTGLAVVKIGGNLIGGLLDRGSNFFRPNHIVISDLPGGLGGAGGGAAMLAGRAGDPTGLGLRSADLLDKNGNVLRGAALDARLQRLSDERLPQTTTASLRMAARNAGTIIKGGAALGTAIAAIGAGIAGATWLVGLALPTFAKGLKSFNEVDGANLKGVGIGMAGLGAGILAMAAGEIIGFFNTITSVFGARSPLEKAVDQLVEFQKLDIDADKVEKNGKAAIAYAKAMGSLALLEVLKTNTFTIVAGFFDGPEIPYDDIREFSREEFNAEKVEKNSNAFVKFSNAMASYQGFGALDGLGATATALADAVLKYYEVEPPEQRFKEFSDLVIDPDRTSQNAIAFKAFAEGLSAYRGNVGPGALDAISSLIGNKINLIFGVDGPIEAFVKFSQREDIGDSAEKNARAFFNFARALSMLTGGSIFSNIVDTGTSILSGVSSWVSGIFGGGSSSSGANIDISRASGPWRNDASFMREVERVSRKYGFSSGALIGLMISESGVNPQAVNPNGGATGLIQFIPSTARGLGTTTAALYRMNRTQQMAYVDKYFQPYANGLRGASAGKLYAYVFLPGRANRASGILTQRPEKEYQQNRGLDMNRDGMITISDLDRRISDKIQGARVGGLFAGPSSGYPIELHGTELIVPVDIDSVLMKLATDPASPTDDSAFNQPGDVASKVSLAGSRSRNRSVVSSEKIETINTVFDRIISTIESTDDIDQKILRYS